MPCNSFIGLTPIRTIRADWARIGVIIYKKWFFTFWAKRIFKLRQLSNLFKQHTSCNGHIAITIHIVSCLKITPAAPAQSSHTLGFCLAWEFLMGGAYRQRSFRWQKVFPRQGRLTGLFFQCLACFFGHAAALLGCLGIFIKPGGFHFFGDLLGGYFCQHG